MWKNSVTTREVYTPRWLEIALRINSEARSRFACCRASKSYTNTFVSTKNLSLIHLFPSEFAARYNVAPESLHQAVVSFNLSATCGVLLEPFAKCSIERLAFR